MTASLASNDSGMVFAPRWRRHIAAVVDIVLAVGALIPFARSLPKGPPPANAMAFYSQQDFQNYFTVIGAACALLALVFAFVLVSPWKGTVGHLVAGIRLASLDGRRPAPGSVYGRFWRALIGLLLICIPGPVIALLVAVTAASALSVPFDTADQLLRQAKLPDALRVAVHGLSVVALCLAVWCYILRGFTMRHLYSNSLTGRDSSTKSTYVIHGRGAL